MRFGRFELAIRSFGFDWVPHYAHHKSVDFDESHYADEHCLHWLMFRFSFYHNLMTWREKLDRDRIN